MFAVVGRWWNWAAWLVLLISTLPYWGGVHHGFHYDDFHSVVRNPHIRELENIPSFFTNPHLFSVNPTSAMYRPVLLVSYAINYTLGGDQPAGYHLVNVLIHGINAVLLLGFGRMLGMRREIAFVAAILFGVTPLNSEAVHYISSRSEIMMATFFLLTCMAYLRFKDTHKFVWYGAALVSCSLALLTKSVAVVLPGALLSCDVLRCGWGTIRQSWRAYMPFVGFNLVYIFFTNQLINKAFFQPVRSWDIQLWTQIKAQVYYLFWMIVPVELSVERQFFSSATFADIAVLAALALVGSLILVIICCANRLMQFLAVWWWIALVPTMLVPLIVLVNEHRLYISLVGWAVGFAGLGYKVPLRVRPVALACLGAYTIILLSLTVQRSAVWADELSLWEDAVLKSSSMVKPHVRLADELERRGRLLEAETAYRHALALKSEHLAARNNLGTLLLKMGRLDDAELEFRTLLKVYPKQMAARFNLAKTLITNKGDWQAAAMQYRHIIQQDSTNQDAWEYLGNIALSYQQNPQAALTYYDKAIIFGGVVVREPLYIHKAVALTQLGLVDKAEALYRGVLSRSPEQVQAWFNLGNIYWRSQQYDKARKAYTKVKNIGTDPALAQQAEQRLKQQPIP